VVLWFTYLLCECVYVLHTEVCVLTAYRSVCRGASCVKLHVAGHLGCCIVQWAVQQSIIALPHSDIHCVTSTAPLSPCFMCCVSVAHTSRDLGQLRQSCGDATTLRISITTPLFCDCWVQGVPKNWTPWWSTGSVFYLDHTADTPPRMCHEWAA
jgi:hypothetical protein